MLTEKQIEEYRAKYNIQPDVTTSSPSRNRINALKGTSTSASDRIASLKESAPITHTTPVTLPPKKSILQKIGGEDSLAGKIGNFASEGIEDIVKTTAGLGVSGTNMLGATKALIKGKGYDSTKSRNIPLLGETKPFITGEESFGQGVGKMFSGGATIASLLPTGKLLQAGKKVIPAVKGVVTEAAEKVIPFVEKKISEQVVKKSIDKAKNALELSTEELAKVNKKNLQYLSQTGLRKVEQVGGFFKGKAFKMTKQVEDLANEFAPLLKSKDPSKNIANVIKEGENLDNISTQLVQANKKLMNLQTVKARLNDSIKGLKDSVYSMASKEQKRALSNQVVDDFLSYVKEGSNAGLNEARKAWRAANAGTSGTLSKANEVVHKALQDMIEETLPEAFAKTYKLNRTQMAKLFDVQEILQAKRMNELGKSTWQKVKGPLKNTAIGAASALGIKSIIQ